MYKLFYHENFNDYINDTKIDENIKMSIDKTIHYLSDGNFKSADCKKLQGTSYDRAKINKKARILFTKDSKKQRLYLVELLLSHDYSSSKYLNGKTFKLEDFNENELIDASLDIENVNTLKLMKNKLIFFNHTQEDILTAPVPMIIIGSAGSGKTTVTIEKLKNLEGKVLYISFASNLVLNSKKLCGVCENIDFLTFNTFLNNVQKQEKNEITFSLFKVWANKHIKKDFEKYYEEFRGVLTGGYGEDYLSYDDYFKLGVLQAIFLKDDRKNVYELFKKYLVYLDKENLYDSNIISFELLKNVEKNYDFIVIDEVQDFSNMQIHFIVESLKKYCEKNFIFSGDSNQILYANYFSWSNLKTMLFKKEESMDIKILKLNYRNSQIITEASNKILKIKQLRFASIDKESDYLMETTSKDEGKIVLYKENENIVKTLNETKKDSVNVAVIVLNEEMKMKVKNLFNTELIFTVQEVKGLEFESIILYNFISNDKIIFSDIVKNIDKDDLSKPLKYSKVSNKENKDLDIFKIYINSLYVAFTRAIDKIYLLEEESEHQFLKLLELDEENAVNIQVETSTDTEWLEKAKQLRENNNIEQAQAIEEKQKKKNTTNIGTVKEHLKDKIVEKKHLHKKAVKLITPKLVSNYESEKNKFFEIKTPSRQNKINYFKMAKKEEDIDSLKILAHKLKFKAAIQYLEKYYNTLLHQALNEEKIDLLDKLMLDNVDISKIKIANYIKDDNSNFVQILIENGADIDSFNSFGKTPLFSALERKSYKIVKLLIVNNADIYRVGKDGWTPLQVLSQFGQEEMIQLLLAKNVNIDAKNLSGTTALMLAVESKQINTVKLLLEHKADIHIKAKNNENVFHIAIRHKQSDLIKLFINEGIDVNDIGTLDNSSPLMNLAFMGDIDNINLLLEKGANIAYKNDKGANALHFATSHNNMDVIKLLLDGGANPNIQSSDTNTALLASVHNNDLESIKILIEYGAEINMLNKEGVNALLLASSAGHLDIVKYLISEGADVNQTAINGVHILITAAKHFEIVKFLLENNHIDDVDKRGSNDDPVLMIASVYGKLKIVELLLKYGANPNIKSDDLETALSYAVANEHLSIVELLIKNGAEINSINKLFVTPLIAASVKGNEKIIRLLLENGADKTVLFQNKTAYDYAREHKGIDEEVLKLLMLNRFN